MLTTVLVVAWLVASIAGCASETRDPRPAPGYDAQGNVLINNRPAPRPLPEEEGSVEAVITATVDAAKNPDARVGSFELELQFQREEVLLYELQSRVPEPLSLDFDPGQYSSGRIRILGVNTTEELNDGPSGSFEVARLSFAPAPPRTLSELRQALEDDQISCEILTARAYGPLPDQQPIAVHFEVRFYFAVRRVE